MSLRHFVRIFALCWLAVSVCFAQDQALEKALLWQIKGKGLRPSYLFGTIHLIDADRYFLPGGVERALKKSRRLVLEIDMSNPLAMAMEMALLAPMKDGKRLSDLYSKEEYALVKEFLSNPGNQAAGMLGVVPFETLETWKPFFIQTMLDQGGADLSGGAVKSYEMELMALTQKRRDKMPLSGLETIADQIGIFDQIPYEQQAQFLLESVRAALDGEPSEARDAEDAQKIVELYCDQDIEGMIALTASAFEKMPGSDELLLYKRNRNWIDKIKAMAGRAPCFFAVGAGHLGGEQGVVRLLRQAGLRLRPVFK